MRRTVGRDFARRLGETYFGTEGVRYRRLGIAEALERLPDPVFFELWHDDQLVGTYALSETPLRLPGGAGTGLYRGLLTVKPEAQGQGLGKRMVDEALSHIRARGEALSHPLVTWGCIEGRNERSLGLLRSRGALELGRLETMLVYRQWPRPRVDVTTIDVTTVDDAGRAVVDEALTESRADCGLSASASGAVPFYAVTDDTGIVAGARATVTRVDMERIGGLWDLLNDRLFRYVPPARRRFDRRNFTYVRLSDIVVREGQTSVWPDFLTTLMARHGAHMAMLVVDPRSRASRLLHEAGVFGRFAAATRQELVVLGTAINLAEPDLALLAGKPLGLGPLDI